MEKNANVTIYVNRKQQHFQALERKQIKFNEKISNSVTTNLQKKNHEILFV